MKKLISCMLAFALVLGLCACGNTEPTTTAGGSSTTEASKTEPVTTAAPTESKSNNMRTDRPSTIPEKGTTLRVYSLKGPTSMGIATLLQDSKEGTTHLHYESTVCTAADEVTAALISGKADVALLPANAAAALYNKAGGFSVIAINTLGVLYVVENGESIQSVKDLAGKTVCLTGKGTTPEYALRYILAANGIEDQVTLEFKSEAQEVVAAMSEDVATIGLLPQPFVTAAMMQNDKLRIALDLNNEWSAVSEGSALVTGVTVVRNEVLAQNREMVNIFLEEASHGVKQVNEDPAAAAELIVNMGIVAKAPIAEKAIPYCNLVCITGEEMKTMLSGYLETLYNQNDKAVGGAMPADAFYFVGE